MSKEIINELIEISSKKLVHLKNILEITQQQRDAIEKEDVDKLHVHITKKQGEINSIDKLDLEFSKKYEELKKINNINSIEEIDKECYPQLKNLKTIIHNITSILNSIQEAEAVNNEKLKGKFEHVKTKLREVKLGKKAVKGYNSYKKMSGSMFINKKK